MFNSKRNARWCTTLLLSCTAVGCRDLTQTLPPGAIDPIEVKNAGAAYGAAIAAHLRWQKGLSVYIIQSGLLTDELQANTRGSPDYPSGGTADLDARNLSNTTVTGSYNHLHNIRGMTRQAIGALAKYAGDSSAARRGELYAFMGYAEVMLADMFCSGVPLSTWDFEADFTYHASSSTAEVYEHAITLFDTAMRLANDSMPIIHLASVGKARAQLALGHFATAAATVENVPPDFVYAERIKACDRGNQCAGDSLAFNFGYVSVSNGEGGQSIIRVANPRTIATRTRTTDYGFPVYFPQKYVRNGVSTVVVASGTEAALIKAEAALRAGEISKWVDILSILRAQHPATDTMAPVVDPGPATRADTLFAERAQWLFLTGHRQGDLRRFIRQYPPRTARNVYPSGSYPGRIGQYGNAVSVPFDQAESRNPKFHGCFDQEA